MDDVHVNMTVHVSQWALPIVDRCRPFRAMGFSFSPSSMGDAHC
ncbi:hypothetical protein [Arcicella rigui]|uniref:Uncharacterized protein n=1 Tax=Arcicella rigui TaxID=797020 RepID=A0ABU5QG23_9BACT|nr:hypothetical protein [Arcicella rigui]MEA5141824.1 hypothetical protein [Arcicella rigui]